MSRIANQNNIFIVPRIAFYRYQRRCRILKKIFQQVGHHRDSICKILLKKMLNSRLVGQFFKTIIAFKRHKKRTGKTIVRVGQSNHHEATTRPNMKRVFVHFKRSRLCRRNIEFLVTIVQIRLRIIETRQFL